ncbi:MAG: FISUMP domain-containing protein [Fibrobacter sp.]|nr:FISUMP domain-containing protein [Fibrobacter sp.]
MFCIKCGASLKEGAKFCNKCGAKQTANVVVDPAPASAPAPVDAPLSTPVSDSKPVEMPKPIAPAPSPDPAPVFNVPPKAPEIDFSEPSSKKSKGLFVGVGLGIAAVAATVVVLTSGPAIDAYFNPGVTYGKIVDTRDNQEYRTIKIGNQEWIAQNMNYSINNSVCDTCEIYGRLYTYDDAQKACPTGYTVPTKDDVDALLTTASASRLVSQKLNGSDDFGFSGITSGFYSVQDHVVKRKGEVLGFWVVESNEQLALRVKIDASKGSIDVDALKKDYGFSVRCINKNNSVNNTQYFIDSRDARIYKTVTLGEQTWLAENLRRRAAKSFCYNDEDPNCDVYGRLYDYETAKTVCPEGWRLPNLADVKQIVSNGYASTFPMTYAGFRNKNGEYDLLDVRADFWTVADKGKAAIYWYASSSEIGVIKDDKYDKQGAMAVRCIQGSLGGEIEYSQIVDDRDGHTYRTVKVGNQEWLAENVNFDQEETYCYNNDEDNCSTYGRLYSWEGAKTACPTGSHLPSDKELQTLKDYVNEHGDGNIASNLKATEIWKNVGNDMFGLRVLPAGSRDWYKDQFENQGVKASFWSANSRNDDDGSLWVVNNRGENFIRSPHEKMNAHTVRCILD